MTGNGLRLCAGLFLGFLPAYGPAGLANAHTVSLDVSRTAEFLTQSWGGASSGQFTEEVVRPLAIPFSNSSRVVYGSTTTTVTHDLSDRGFQIDFDFAPGSGSLGGSSAMGQFSFSVDQDTPYLAEGWLTAMDPDAHSLRFVVILHDNHIGDFVFYSAQDSISTPNESFTLGGNGGDFSNQSFGDFSGTLLAGHRYELFYNNGLFDLAAPYASGTSASGSFSLLLPEPGMATLVLLGGLGMALRARHSRWR